MRPIAAPFVVAPPAGVRVRARLKVDAGDEAVLGVIGEHLGSLAGKDLAARCKEGLLDAKGRAASRQVRKQAMTAKSSSRWAGAITRSSEDAWQLARRNLVAERRSLLARSARIRRRLALPVGRGRGQRRGYPTSAERFQKQRRLQVLDARAAEVERQLAAGQVSVCRGGARLARAHHHLAEAHLTETGWQERWSAERLFLTADGEADKTWGNETIRWHPEEHWLELRLPAPLAHLANRPHCRFRLSCPVTFTHRADDVAAQATSGAVRYDVSFDPKRHRWYVDASWKLPQRVTPTLDEIRQHKVLAVDVNAGHLALMVVDQSGNPVGDPVTVPLQLSGLAATTRDGRLRSAISTLLSLAEAHGCQALVIEDLDFLEHREAGREQGGRRPARGKRGRGFRRMVAGIPTARFRERLVQMATNRRLFVVAVDPAYTTKWGTDHWLGALLQISPAASGHHAAALVVGRRGLGHRARRREGCASTPPEDGEERATNSAGQRTRPTRKAAIRKAKGPSPEVSSKWRQPRRHKTPPAERDPVVDQVAQDRSGPPVGASAHADGH